jgi:hypothetical protein
MLESSAPWTAGLPGLAAIRESERPCIGIAKGLAKSSEMCIMIIR